MNSTNCGMKMKGYHDFFSAANIVVLSAQIARPGSLVAGEWSYSVGDWDSVY